MNVRRPHRLSRAGQQRGSALLIVLVLLLLVSAFVVGNALALHHLRAELQRLDRQQQKKFDVAPSRSVEH
jgi:Tfp pilus assembly protein PilX